MNRISAGRFALDGNDAGGIGLGLVVIEGQGAGQHIAPGPPAVHHGPGFSGIDDQQHGALIAMPHDEGFLALFRPQGGVGLLCGGNHRQQFVFRGLRIPDQGGGRDDHLLSVDGDGAGSEAKGVDFRRPGGAVPVHVGDPGGDAQLGVGLGQPGRPFLLGQVPGAFGGAVIHLNGAGLDGHAAVGVDDRSCGKPGGGSVGGGDRHAAGGGIGGNRGGRTAVVPAADGVRNAFADIVPRQVGPPFRFGFVDHLTVIVYIEPFRVFRQGKGLAESQQLAHRDQACDPSLHHTLLCEPPLTSAFLFGRLTVGRSVRSLLGEPILRAAHRCREEPADKRLSRFALRGRPLPNEPIVQDLVAFVNESVTFP